MGWSSSNASMRSGFHFISSRSSMVPDLLAPTGRRPFNTKERASAQVRQGVLSRLPPVSSNRSSYTIRAAVPYSIGDLLAEMVDVHDDVADAMGDQSIQRALEQGSGRPRGSAAWVWCRSAAACARPAAGRQDHWRYRSCGPRFAAGRAAAGGRPRSARAPAPRVAGRTLETSARHVADEAGSRALPSRFSSRTNSPMMRAVTLGRHQGEKPVPKIFFCRAPFRRRSG